MKALFSETPLIQYSCISQAKPPSVIWLVPDIVYVSHRPGSQSGASIAARSKDTNAKLVLAARESQDAGITQFLRERFALLLFVHGIGH